MSRLVFATRNRGKLAELNALVAPLGLAVVSAAELGAPDVEEDGDTFEANAVKKARVVFEATGLPSIADDTGLEVDALNGAPGVRSARFAGPDCNPADNRKKLLASMANARSRHARFRTVVALVSSSDVVTFEGMCEGVIAETERGSRGFGYDALFVPLGSDRTFAEMESPEKNEISHRGSALRKLRAYLETVPQT